MNALQRRWPIGDGMQARTAIAGPMPATGLADGHAKLGGIEVRLQHELEANGSQHHRVAGELGAQRGERG